MALWEILEPAEAEEVHSEKKLVKLVEKAWHEKSSVSA